MLEDHRQVQRQPSDLYDYQNDGASTDDEDAEPEADGGNNSSAPPRILTTGLIVETAEGTTVNLPCKVSEGSCKYTSAFIINRINIHKIYVILAQQLILLVFIGKIVYFRGI